MTPRSSSTCFLEHLLPPRAPVFERLCQYAQRDRGWAGLVVESLIQGPLGVLVDNRFLPSRREDIAQAPSTEQLVPMSLRHPGHGIETFSWAVFSRPAHYFALPGPLGPYASYFTFVSGLRALEVLLERENPGQPVVVDPTWPHSVQLSADELRACVRAWHGPHGSTTDEGDICGMAMSGWWPAAGHRLPAFLQQLPGVSQAWVLRCWLVAQPNVERQTLVVEGDDEASLMRIRKALPLLNWGLAEHDAITLAVPVRGELRLAPVYRA